MEDYEHSDKPIIPSTAQSWSENLLEHRRRLAAPPLRSRPVPRRTEQHRCLMRNEGMRHFAGNLPRSRPRSLPRRTRKFSLTPFLGANQTMRRCGRQDACHPHRLGSLCSSAASPGKATGLPVHHAAGTCAWAGSRCRCAGGLRTGALTPDRAARPLRWTAERLCAIAEPCRTGAAPSCRAAKRFRGTATARCTGAQPRCATTNPRRKAPKRGKPFVAAQLHPCWRRSILRRPAFRTFWGERALAENVSTRPRSAGGHLWLATFRILRGGTPSASAINSQASQRYA